MAATTTLRIGIASVEKQRQWALEIASGKRRHHEDDPVVWFPSMSAASRVLSDENKVLINAIREFHRGTSRFIILEPWQADTTP